jgi:hypothetical protein
MSFPIDATLKDVMEERPADYAAPFGLPTDQPVVVLNVDLSTISAATDVALGIGDPLREIADFNFQSGCDPFADYRLYLYNAAFAHHFHVAVRSFLVLLRPKADHPNLTGILTYTAGGTRVEFPYEVIRLWERPVEPFLTGGLGLLPLAVLCAMPPDVSLEQALARVVAEIHRRVKAETSPAEAVKMMTAAYMLTGMRVERAIADQIYEEYGMLEESTTYQGTIEKGRIREAHRILLRQGRTRFGPPDAATETALTSVNDLERLERMTDAVPGCDDVARPASHAVGTAGGYFFSGAATAATALRTSAMRSSVSSPARKAKLFTTFCLTNTSTVTSASRLSL